MQVIFYQSSFSHDQRKKWGCLGITHHVWTRTSSSVKHSGGGILDSNGRSFVWQPKLGPNCVIQHNNNPTSANPQQWVKKKRIKVSQWPQVQTSACLKCCGGTLTELCINKGPPNLSEMKHDWTASCENLLFHMTAVAKSMTSRNTPT